MEHELLNLNLDLPNHSQELKILKNKLLFDIEPKLKPFHSYDNDIPDKIYFNVVDEILEILYKVGGLSEVIFEIRNDLEEKYSYAFRHSPLLAKKLWQKHYHELHKPYNSIKDIAFSYLDFLELKYIEVNKRKPPVIDRIVIDC